MLLKKPSLFLKEPVSHQWRPIFLIVKINIIACKNHSLPTSVNISDFNKGNSTISNGSNTVYIFSETFFHRFGLSLSLPSGILCCRISHITDEKLHANLCKEIFNSCQSEFGTFKKMWLWKHAEFLWLNNRYILKVKLKYLCNFFLPLNSRAFMKRLLLGVKHFFSAWLKVIEERKTPR